MPVTAARIALLGCGAIARSLAASLESGPGPLHVGAVLVRAGGDCSFNADKVFGSIEDLIDWRPTIVAECAGHEAVRSVVPALLAAGIDVVVASVGALCDPHTRAELYEARLKGRSHLSFATGAVGGLDALAAARLGGLDSVLYIGRKPPHAWPGKSGVPAPLGNSPQPMVIFEGNAGEAARLFPQNANVAAAIALAGAGFEATKVRLLADPAISRNIHEIQARGAFGELLVRVTNEPLVRNPKTSHLAALSLERAIRDSVGPSMWS